MLDYMECRIAATIQSTTDCGCDSKLIATTDEQTPQPLHQHQLKNYTEEFYDHSFEVSSTIWIRELLSYNIFSTDQLPSGFCKSIFQPPRI